jgi:hypothetical protein
LSERERERSAIDHREAQATIASHVGRERERERERERKRIERDTGRVMCFRRKREKILFKTVARENRIKKEKTPMCSLKDGFE